jgi:hypothetical protein
MDAQFLVDDIFPHCLLLMLTIALFVTLKRRQSYVLTARMQCPLNAAGIRMASAIILISAARYITFVPYLLLQMVSLNVADSGRSSTLMAISQVPMILTGICPVLDFAVYLRLITEFRRSLATC